MALLANALSPRGLSLGRDYFPAPTAPVGAARPDPAPAVPVEPGAATRPSEKTASTDPAPGGGAGAGVAAPADPDRTPAPTSSGSDEVRRRLAARGLKTVGVEEARVTYEDPRHGQEVWIFVDARNEAQFEEGHVPGAYVFDRYYPEKHLPSVVPACQQAERILVYCIGGECEDSELAAAALIEAGIPADRMAVYLGGIRDWQAHGNPVETGPRGSGRIREATP